MPAAGLPLGSSSSASQGHVSALGVGIYPEPQCCRTMCSILLPGKEHSPPRPARPLRPLTQGDSPTMNREFGVMSLRPRRGSGLRAGGGGYAACERPGRSGRARPGVACSLQHGRASALQPPASARSHASRGSTQAHTESLASLLRRRGGGREGWGQRVRVKRRWALASVR